MYKSTGAQRSTIEVSNIYDRESIQTKALNHIFFYAKIYYFLYEMFLPSEHSSYQGTSRNTSLNRRMCQACLFPFLHFCFHIYGRCISRMIPFILRDFHSSTKLDSLTSLVAPQAEGSQELEAHRMMDNISLGWVLPNIVILTLANLSWKSSK